ncbi:MAG: type II secretion system protein [Candidatus Moraniibacteriota bacterium]
MKNNNKTGFTLIEVMVAIAIIGILAAVVTVSMSSYGKKARASKAMAQASSAIPSMVSCAGNIGNSAVRFSGYICGSSNQGYGSWPVFPSGYSVNASDWTSSSNWYFRVYSSADSQTICCNSAMNSCGQPSVACSATAIW